MAATSITLKLQPNVSTPQRLRIQRGAYGANNTINFTIQNSDGSVHVITGLELTMMLFEIWRRIPILEKTLTIVSGPDGTAKYVPLEGDFDILSTYYMKVSLKDSSNKEFTEESIFEIE